MTEAPRSARKRRAACAGLARRPALRRALASAVLLGIVIFLSVHDASGRDASAHDPSAHDAGASAAAEALADARARLHATPRDLEGARASLERAIAAGDDPGSVAEAHFHLGGLEEEHGEFARALEQDRAAVDAAPTSRWARSARARAAWLGERSEGGFVPLARLMSIWRDPRFGSDPVAVEAFAREVETFPPGVVRGEARMLLADVWLHRLRRPEQAKRELLLVRDDRAASEQSTTFAERELAEELLTEGRLDDVATELEARGSRLEPDFVQRARGQLRHRFLMRATWTAIATALVLVVAAAYLHGRRASRAKVTSGSAS